MNSVKIFVSEKFDFVADLPLVAILGTDSP